MSYAGINYVELSTSVIVPPTHLFSKSAAADWYVLNVAESLFWYDNIDVPFQQKV